MTTKLPPLGFICPTASSRSLTLSMTTKLPPLGFICPTAFEGRAARDRCSNAGRAGCVVIDARLLGKAGGMKAGG